MYNNNHKKPLALELGKSEFPSSYLVEDENDPDLFLRGNSLVNRMEVGITPDHISAVFKERLVCDKDDRIQMSTEHFPNNAICLLAINDHRGKQFIGTGFLISPTCVITSGHCVYNKGRWVKSIVVIPGANGNGSRPYGARLSTRFKSVKGWTRQGQREFDYGAALLEKGEDFSHLSQFFETEVIKSEQKISNAGYSTEANKKHQQWGSSGMIEKMTYHKLYYNIDTTRGNSGSPVIIDKNKAVGIHSFGNCPNFCVRINEEVKPILDRWRKA